MAADITLRDTLDLWELRLGDIPAAVGDTTTVNAADLFGSVSTLADNSLMVPAMLDTPLFSGTLLFQIFSLLLFVSYITIIIVFMSNALSLVKIMGSKLYTEKILGEHNYTFRRFLSLLSVSGAVSVSMVVLRFADIYYPSIAASLPDMVVQVSLPIIVSVIFGIRVYRAAILKLAGRLTFSEGFTDSLLLLSRMIYALGAIFIIPTSFLFILNVSAGVKIVGYILIAQMTLLLLFLLYKTFRLFSSQKVSIMHWFLYLCGVEFFPISLVIIAGLQSY